MWCRFMCKSNMVWNQEDSSEFSANLAVRGFHIDHKSVATFWTASKNVAMFVSDHNDTGAYNDKPIVGYLHVHVPWEFLYAHASVFSCVYTQLLKPLARFMYMYFLFNTQQLDRGEYDI